MAFVGYVLRQNVLTVRSMRTVFFGEVIKHDILVFGEKK